MVRKVEPIYSGSFIRASPCGHFIFCDCGDNGLKLVSTSDGSVFGTIQPPEEAITAVCCFYPNGDSNAEFFNVVTSSHNGMLRQWRVHITEDNEDQATIVLERSWKAQPLTPAGRVSQLEIDKTGTLLASACSDGSCRIWDLERRACTHLLRGHTGVISLVKFFSKDNKHHYMFTSANGDSQLRVWNLNSGSTPTHQVLNGHATVCTGLTFCGEKEDLMVTVGRDQMVIVWDTVKFEKIRAWPVFEQVEAVANVESPKLGNNLVAICGSRGDVRLWDVSSGRNVTSSQPLVSSRLLHQQEKMESESESQQHSEEDDFVSFNNMISLNKQELLCSTTDRRFIYYSIVDEPSTVLIKETKQTPGDVGEVLDICHFKLDNQEELLAVATNSPMIRVYSIDSSWDCHFLLGHKQAVTSLSKHGSNLLISGSRDNDVLVWSLQSHGKSQLLAKAAGHTSSVLSVAACSNGSFFATAGVDLTLKLWPVPKHGQDDLQLHCLATAKAHDKDINSLAVSPNGKFLASGSQDKTAKVWMTSDSSLQLVGTMRGHKRAVWSVDFSPVDQLLATSSADTTIKLWALSNCNCIRTFEGHDVAVLKCKFMSRGLQLVTGGSDGVVRIWSIQSGESVASLDEDHDDKAWAVCPINDGNMLATGSSDDKLVLWHDYTSEYVEECVKREHARAMDSQRLDNLLMGKKFVEAFKLALELNQPQRLWRIVKEIRLNDQVADIGKIIQQLSRSHMASLLRFVAAWNSNTRFTLEAQFMLNVILSGRSIDELLEIIKEDLPTSSRQLLKDSIEALIAYSQRHFARIDRLATNCSFVDFAWSQLKIAQPPQQEAQQAQPLPATTS